MAFRTYFLLIPLLCALPVEGRSYSFIDGLLAPHKVALDFLRKKMVPVAHKTTVSDIPENSHNKPLVDAQPFVRADVTYMPANNGSCGAAHQAYLVAMRQARVK